MQLELGFEEEPENESAEKSGFGFLIRFVAVLLLLGITYGSYRWVMAPLVPTEKRIVDNRAMPHFPLFQYLQELDAKRKAERNAEVKKLQRHGGIDRATCAGFVGNRTCQIYL